jgi:hypothetical protein
MAGPRKRAADRRPRCAQAGRPDQDGCSARSGHEREREQAGGTGLFSELRHLQVRRAHPDLVRSEVDSHGRVVPDRHHSSEPEAIVSDPVPRLVLLDRRDHRILERATCRASSARRRFHSLSMRLEIAKRDCPFGCAGPSSPGGAAGPSRSALPVPIRLERSGLGLGPCAMVVPVAVPRLFSLTSAERAGVFFFGDDLMARL